MKKIGKRPRGNIQIISPAIQLKAPPPPHYLKGQCTIDIKRVYILRVNSQSYESNSHLITIASF